MGVHWCFTLSISCWLTLAAQAWQAQTGTASADKVLLSKVQTLTLNEGVKTTGRRSRPVPQLDCKGYNCKKGFQPSSVQCYNRGSDGVDVQWECTATMPTGFSFGRTEVSCEGYEYPDDPYILRGSCQLGYELKYDSAAAARGASAQHHNAGGRFDAGNPRARASAPPQPPTHGHKKSGYGWTTYGLMGLILWLVTQLCTAGTRRRGAARQAAANPYAAGPPGGRGVGGIPSGGGGGFGFGTGAGSTGGTTYSSAGPQSGSWFGSAPPAPDDGTNCGASAPPAPGSTSTRTGAGSGNFWTGLAAGGGLGYFLRNRGTATQTRTNEGMRQRPTATMQQQHNQYSSSRRDSDSSPSAPTTQTSFATTTRR